MRIFIDLGCYDGDTIRQFYNWWPFSNIYKVYGFDPNPSPYIGKGWQDIKEKFPDVKFVDKAAWTSYGYIPYRLDQSQNPWGSTAVGDKRLDGAKEIQVASVDFSDTLKRLQLLSQAGEVLIKMDIEGAEFEVLEKMIRDETIKLVSHLWVEWHDSKMTPEYTVRKEKIIDYLKRNKISWSEWS